MPKSIGQYRYKGAGSCITTVLSGKGYQNTSLTGDETVSTSFKDVVITTSSGPLLRDTDYYLYVKIPQNMNYDLSFNIKLIKQEGDASVYQFLKNISIPKGGNASNVYNVVLYELSSGDIQAMIPLPYVAGATNKKDLLYYDKNSKKYYLGNGNSTYTETSNINDVSIVASWNQVSGENFGYAEIVFRPVEDSFGQILIEMVRTAEDYNIQYDNDDGSTGFGRIIPLDEFDYELLQIKNLVDEINPEKTLERIGVWGHPNLLMAVNGEEIRIGASSYYELDVLPIKSLGVVAKDYKDNFSIDYQFEIE